MVLEGNVMTVHFSALRGRIDVCELAFALALFLHALMVGQELDLVCVCRVIWRSVFGDLVRLMRSCYGKVI